LAYLAGLIAGMVEGLFFQEDDARELQLFRGIG
jgi:hypothetical protein